ncbi:unnamed protein product, partial [marine sediment metagenome]
QLKSYRNTGKIKPLSDPEKITKIRSIITDIYRSWRHIFTKKDIERIVNLEKYILEYEALLKQIKQSEDEISQEESSLDDLRRSLDETRSELKKYRKFYGYIVARFDANLYEIAPMRWDYYWGSYPSMKHAILRTMTVEYTTKGTFSLWVKDVGTMPITTVDGFQETWTVYEEASEASYLKERKKEITDSIRDTKVILKKKKRTKSSLLTQKNTLIRRINYTLSTL